MLLSFQKPAVAAVLKHIRQAKTKKWNGINIHPPLVVNASVSSGKSVMAAEVSKAVISMGASKNNRVRVLIIQRQGELCKQNSDAAWSIELQNSIYSAALNSKSAYYDVVYATEGTLINALEKEFRVDGGFHPDIILIDEGHQVNYEELDTMFMRCLMHFYLIKPKLRVICLTGSPFRGTDSIIGDYWDAFAQMEASDPLYPDGGQGNGLISTEWMVENAWVTPIQFGWPSHEGEDTYDFSSLETKPGSVEFNEAELDEATKDEEKLLRIMAEVVERSRDRLGVLLFAATKRHTLRIADALRSLGVGDNDIGIITDDTGDTERGDILDRAKDRKCKFVINVGVLTTGINVPVWDTLVYLRPIGSLVLLIQSIGRVLRLLIDDGAPGMVERDSLTVEERFALIAASEKPFSLLLDYAGVMDRLGHLYENPILEKAEKEHAKQKNETIFCPVCNEENSMFARRCIGYGPAGRCDHFWQSKSCPDCGTKNDIVARECRSCHRELINPNEKLQGKHYTDAELTPVVSMTMSAKANGMLTVKYLLSDGREPVQFFYPNAGNNPVMNTRIWWNNFVKYHVMDKTWQGKARSMRAATVEKMAAMFSTPTHLSARENNGKWTIGRRLFRDMEVMEASDEIVAEETA
jgi:superfamily II DNA or RNA helicase